MLDMGAAVGAVDVTISRVTAIANAKLPGAEDDVTTHARAFRTMPVTAADFGEVPAAQELAEHHEAARAVFDSTIQGVLRDLREFRAALLECMRNHEATDDSVQAALLSLSSRYTGHRYHSLQDNWRSRQEQGSHLGEAGQPLDGGNEVGDDTSPQDGPPDHTPDSTGTGPSRTF